MTCAQHHPRAAHIATWWSPQNRTTSLSRSIYAVYAMSIQTLHWISFWGNHDNTLNGLCLFLQWWEKFYFI